MDIFSSEVKIDTDVSNNFFDIYNEARGIAMNKSKILKNKRITGMNYISYLFLIFTIVFILNMIFIIQFKDMYLSFFAVLLLVLDIIYFILGLCRIYVNYFFKKKSNFISTVFINRRGITDVSSFDNMELLFLWKRVEGVVVGHYSVVVFLSNHIYLYFNIKDKKKIIDGIKKFKKNILIIK